MKNNGPDFIGIGAMKAGTTSLDSLLRSHPDLDMPSIKETRYYLDEKFRKKHLWKNDGRLKVDIKPDYSKYPQYAGIPEKIFSENPNAKIIYVVRNPVHRFISHINHNLALGRLQITHVDQIINDLTIQNKYASPGLYLFQINRYLACFPKKQIFVLSIEQMIYDFNSTLEKLCQFLEIDPEAISKTSLPKEHKTSEKIVLSRKGKFINKLLPYRTARNLLSGSLRRKLKPFLTEKSKAVPFKPSSQQIQKLKNFYEKESKQLFQFFDCQFYQI